MLLSRISKLSRSGSLLGCRWLLSHRPYHRLLLVSGNSQSPAGCTQKAFSCREAYLLNLPATYGFKHHIHQSSSLVEDQLDPFSLVADELSLLASRLQAMVVAEVPKLASAAEYFFKMGVEGKRFRPTVLLLMATALHVHIPVPSPDGVGEALSSELRTRQQSIAEKRSFCLT